MTSIRRLSLSLLILIGGCASRPPALPAGELDALPWGAVAVGHHDVVADARMSKSIEPALTRGDGHAEDTDGDGIPNYAVLALSGGGANGAFAAGLLAGWTRHGNHKARK